MRLNNNNHFMMNPVNLDINRSKINNPYGSKLTLNAGKLVPFYLHEVIPGETLKLDYSSVIRSITPNAPVMDNAFIDFYFFWVPNRLCTVGEKDWQKVCGENVNGYWAPSTETTLVSSGNSVNIKDLNTEIINSVTYKIAPQSLLNYLGCPVLPVSRVGTGATNTSGVINTLAINGYLRIWNEFFRDENTQTPVAINSNNYKYAGISDRSSATTLVKDVNKFHDLFTSVLPAPQKGANVLLPLGSLAPVIAGSTHTNSSSPVFWERVNGKSTAQFNDNLILRRNSVGGAHTMQVNAPTGDPEDEDGDTISAGSMTDYAFVPNNLWADLSNATAASVNAVRNAFAIQRFLEKSARGGSRYFESLLVHFNVTNPDLVLQRPEYISGKRVPLTISQVTQTSSTDQTSPIGYTGAFSNTAMSDYAFTKSFGEYGYVYGLCCIRNSQSYSQGIPMTFLRNRQYDYYWPSFANLGEKAILKKQLYFSTSSSDNDSVFGYQEAWAEYRYRYNTVLGYFNPDANDTFLSSWTYTNKFNNYPTLNSSFMVQDKSQIDDTLAVSGSLYQFYADLFFDETCVLPMPLYSIPGLIDHH